MTYPPQQPGPGGWGQQPPSGVPGQSPEQGTTPQQQPAWYGNQHTGWAQGPSQPGTPGQGPPPPPDWGNPDLVQTSWALETEGFGEIEPPKKSRLPWILGIAGVLVVAGGGAVALFFVLNGGPGDPKPVAKDVVDNVNGGNFEAIRGDLCQSNQAQLESDLRLLSTGEFDLRLGGVTENGDKATAQLGGTYSMGGASDSVDQVMGLVVEDGQWKVCQFDQ